MRDDNAAFEQILGKDRNKMYDVLIKESFWMRSKLDPAICEKQDERSRMLYMIGYDDTRYTTNEGVLI